MRTMVAALVLTCSSVASAADSGNEVMLQAMKRLDESLHNRQVHPAVLAPRTTGGAEDFARTWLMKHNGDLIGSEIADAYETASASPVAVETLFPAGTPYKVMAEDQPPSYDWESLEKLQPGVRSVIRLSQPVFDKFGTIGVVRADVIGRDGYSFTTFFAVERQSDGGWKFDHAAIGDVAAFQRSGEGSSVASN